MTTHFEPIFCEDCKQTVTMQAAGVLACSCLMVSDPEDDKIPAAWNTTRENCYAVQLAESDYEERQ